MNGESVLNCGSANAGVTAVHHDGSFSNTGSAIVGIFGISTGVTDGNEDETDKVLNGVVGICDCVFP